jgi:hypothetical protein
MLFPNYARNILGKLIKAETNGSPISLQSALTEWGNGSTWEDLVDGGYVLRSREMGVTVTILGREYYNRLA